MASIYLPPKTPNGFMPEGRGEHAARPMSFDDDLTWIAENFAARLFADGACFVRQGGARGPAIIAAVGTIARRTAPAQARLLEMADTVIRAWARSDPREPLLAWSDYDSDGAAGRVLSAPLPPMDGERIVAFAVFGAGSIVVNAAAEAMAIRLQPVLAGYFRLWAKLRAERARAAGLEEALDAQGVGLGVLDRRGCIVFMNAVLRRMADADEGLRVQGDSLVATDVSSAVKFQVAVAQLLGLAGEPDEGRRPAPLVPLRRPRGAGSLVAALSPVSRPAMEPDDAAVVVHLLDPSADGVKTLRPVCALYGLSPVETSLVVRLVAGDTLSDAAAYLRIKDATVRGYLKQVFLKTSVCRQADLIRLMLTNAFRLSPDFQPIVL